MVIASGDPPAQMGVRAANGSRAKNRKDGPDKVGDAIENGGDQIPVRLTLLGGFRARHYDVVPESAWQQRRSAKMLVKVIAVHPSHSLHREQVLELLWPNVGFTSAVNSFAKALHVARRALEPDIAARGTSSYLRLNDDILSLVTDCVWIDADHFQNQAERALRHGDAPSIEEALSLYSGELLPEDTYETWAVGRRQALADLRLRLLLKLADALARRGDRELATERLTEVLQIDPSREEVHRALMRLHAESGRRRQALRQYQLCCEALERELDIGPEAGTELLYEEIRSGLVGELPVVERNSKEVTNVGPAVPIAHPPTTPLLGRERERGLLRSGFARAQNGHGQTVMVSGEPGIGKTRLVSDLAGEAAASGSLVLWGASHDEEALLPFGPFAEALEKYVAGCDLEEQQFLATQYPELASLAPSLGLGSNHQPAFFRQVEQSRLFASIVRFFTELAAKQVVVLVLDDIHAAAWESLQLLQHLARLAGQRRWLIIGTYREEDLVAGGELRKMLGSTNGQGLWRHLNLQRLSRGDCDKLVRSMIHAGEPAPELLQYVYDASLATPLFVLELIGAMQGRGELIFKDGYWVSASTSISRIPRQLGRLVEARVQRLADSAQRVLSLIAIAPDEMSFEELSLTTDELHPEISQAKLLDLLDSALEGRILQETGKGYSFTHPLFRLALSEHLSRERSSQLRAAVARAMEVCRSTQIPAVV